MNIGNNPMLEILLHLAPTLNWLLPVQVNKIPHEHRAALKQLEQLGLAKEIIFSDKKQQEHSIAAFESFIGPDYN